MASFLNPLACVRLGAKSAEEPEAYRKACCRYRRRAGFAGHAPLAIVMIQSHCRHQLTLAILMDLPATHVMAARDNSRLDTFGHPGAHNEVTDFGFDPYQVARAYAERCHALPEPGTVKCVQIDIDPQRISLRYPADVGLVGDTKSTLRALLPLLDKHEKGFLEKAQKAKAKCRSVRVHLRKDRLGACPGRGHRGGQAAFV